MRFVREVALITAVVAGGICGTGAAQSGAYRSATQTVQAEEPGTGCKLCNHNLDTAEHWFTSSCSVGDNDCYDCHAFNACHPLPQPGFWCGQYHWACGSTLAALTAVRNAIAKQDPYPSILNVANKFGGTVHIVAAGYVLVSGCNGGIAAACKLPKERDEATVRPRQLSSRPRVRRAESV